MQQALPGRDRSPRFEVRVETAGGRVTVAPSGELDASTLPTLARRVQHLRDAGLARLHFDLSRLTFIDSSGLHFFYRLSNEDGFELTVTPGPRAVRRAFDLTGLGDAIPFVDPEPLPPPSVLRRDS